MDDIPCDADAHISIANLYVQQGKTTAALEEYRKASTADPANGLALAGLATLLEVQGKPDEAQAALRKAIALLDAQLQQEPVNSKIAYLLGASNYQLREYGAALVAFQKYVVLAPADGSGRDYLASTLEALGRHADALAEWEKAAAAYQQMLSQNPQNPSVLRSLATVQDILKNYAGSAKTYEALVRLRPDDAQAHYSLAFAYLNLNRASDALAEFRAAATLQPANANFQTQLALSLYTLGQNDEAITVAQRALQLDSGQAIAHYTLAVSYKAKGDKAHAIAEFQLVAQSPTATAGLRSLAEQALRELAH